MKQTAFPYWMLTLALVFALTLPELVKDAMFQDAVLYSSVSHNMAQGIGTFWFPQYSKWNIAGIPSFHEHPPLAFGIQSLFFRALGDSLYVERFYTFVCLLLHVLLIAKLWNRVMRDIRPELRAYNFLPVLFWISFPICFWSFRGNMQENTMGIFSLLAVGFVYDALQSGQKLWAKLAISGVMVLLAALCKGLPAFFSLAVPLCHWLAFKKYNFGMLALQTALLVAVPVLGIGILCLFPESRDSLYNYFFLRVLRRIDSMPTTTWYLDIVWRLVTESIPAVLLLTIFYARSKWKKQRIDALKYGKYAYFFFLTGLCGVLPIALTLVQKGLYIVPVFPYMGMAFACLALPYVEGALEKNSPQKWLKIVSIAAMTGVLAFTSLQFGKISREKATLTDVYKIGKIVPRKSALSVPEALYDPYDFILEGFLVRYFNISLDPKTLNDFYLTENSQPELPPAGYARVDIGLEKYTLWRRDLPTQ